jgi:HEAT repeat protein
MQIYEDADTRARAAAFLGKIGTDAKEALPTLRWLLLDEDQRVRDSAEEAIKRIDK